MIAPEFFHALNADLDRLHVTDGKAPDRLLQRHQSFCRDAVCHETGPGIFRQRLLDDRADLSTAAPDKDMGRCRELLQDLRRPSLNDFHIGQAESRAVFIQQFQSVFFIFH